MTSTTQVIMRRWLARTEGAAFLVTMVVAGCLACTGALVDGAAAVQSVGFGAGVVVMFFALGALIQLWALRWLESMGFLVMITGYGLRIGLLSLTASLMVNAAWLPSLKWFAVGIAASTVAWLTGLVVGHVTGRWPVYDLAVMA